MCPVSPGYGVGGFWKLLNTIGTSGKGRACSSAVGVGQQTQHRPYAGRPGHGPPAWPAVADPSYAPSRPNTQDAAVANDGSASTGRSAPPPGAPVSPPWPGVTLSLSAWLGFPESVPWATIPALVSMVSNSGSHYFRRLLGLGCPKQAVAEIVTPRVSFCCDYHSSYTRISRLQQE